MADRKTISLFLYIPETQEVILSVRKEGQSFSGYLQATCHGTIEDGEDHADAIERELREETRLDIVDVGPLEFLGELDAGIKKREDCSYYMAAIEAKNAARMTPTQEVETFVRIKKQQLAQIREHEASKKNTPPDGWTMFTDELEALKMTFAILNK